MNIVFVILSFNIIHETQNCIASIIANIDTDQFHIIVIDNASPNGAGAFLKESYHDNDKVSIHINPINMGFARGNNVGIQLALKMNPKYICCLNNDTLLEQKRFFSILDAVYSRSKAAVIGPKIFLKNGPVCHKNKKLLPINEYQKRVHHKGTDNNLFAKIKRIFLQSHSIYAINHFLRHRDEETEQMDVLLHGCCLIFTPCFFKKLTGFDDRTFLYAEEELLYISLKKNHLTSLYCPQLQIRHIEDVSTDTVAKGKNAKTQFRQKYVQESLEILCDELIQNEALLYSQQPAKQPDA